MERIGLLVFTIVVFTFILFIMFRQMEPIQETNLPSSAKDLKEDIGGTATVLDGDTLDVAGRRIRLNAIDAPESQQTCTAEGAEWPCGQLATAALADVVRTASVSCSILGTDRYGRDIGRCYVEGIDIAAAMVRSGWALAYRQYGADYVDEEHQAKQERLGVWIGSLTPPWQYRQGKVAPIDATARLPP